MIGSFPGKVLTFVESTLRLANWRIVLGGGILTGFVLAAALAPLLAPHNPLEIDPVRSLAPPSIEYPLGNDEFGRDVLSRLVFGARISIAVSMSATVLAGIVGALAGLVAAYYGGLSDLLIMRGCDVLLTIPPIVLAIAVVAAFGPSLPNLILTIALLYVPGFVRVAYSSTKVAKEQDYIQAALAIGADNVYVIRTGVLPAVLAPLIVQAGLTVSAALLLESGLSFIGLGVPPPTPTWGSMVSSARPVMETAPFLVVGPSITLAVTILSFNLLGDGIRDIMDPRWRSMHRRMNLRGG